jgi:hypothetical protein
VRAVTRLRLTNATQRLVVGHDAEMATYYIETGPATSASEPEEDPDEGLIAVRGRLPHDLPDLPALLAELHTRGVTLSPTHSAALQRPGPHKDPKRDTEPDRPTGHNRQDPRRGLRRHRLLNGTYGASGSGLSR